MPGTNQRYVLPDWIENLSFEHALKLLLFGAFGQNAPAGTGVPVTAPTTGTQRSLGSTTATGNGSVTAASKSVSFVSSSDFVGTVNGATFFASSAISIAPPNPSDTNPAIAYTISAGTLRIDVLT